MGNESSYIPNIVDPTRRDYTPNIGRAYLLSTALNKFGKFSYIRHGADLVLNIISEQAKNKIHCIR